MLTDNHSKHFDSEKNDPISSFQLKIEALEFEQLMIIQKKLNFLCHNFDPYNYSDISPETNNILIEFHLKQFIENPFQFTNYLLQLMDNLEQLLKNKIN